MTFPHSPNTRFTASKTERQTVLLAGHDELMSRVLSHKISQELDVEVIVAHHGKELLEVFSRRKIDLIITELYMDFKNGMEVIDEIRNHLQSRVPILLCSGDLTDEVIDETLRFGGNDFIHKPLSINELMIRISILLKRAQYTYD